MLLNEFVSILKEHNTASSFSKGTKTAILEIDGTSHFATKAIIRDAITAHLSGRYENWYELHKKLKPVSACIKGATDSVKFRTEIDEDLGSISRTSALTITNCVAHARLVLDFCYILDHGRDLIRYKDNTKDIEKFKELCKKVSVIDDRLVTQYCSEKVIKMW